MISLEMTKEGYEGIPATAKTLTEDDLRQWVESKDVSLIPLAVAALKKAQSTLSVSSVKAYDEKGAEVTALNLLVGDIVSLKGLHTDECACVDTVWSASGAAVEIIIDGTDSRCVEVRAKAAGSATLTCTVGGASAQVSVVVA